MGALRRVGVYGGSFDPIHIGHLAIAEEVRWALDLDLVLFVPAARQPMKLDRDQTEAAHRLTMTELACSTNPAFQVTPLEMQRPPPSYTITTLRTLHSQFGATAELVFVLGADAARELPRWNEAAAILDLARLAVVERPGTQLDLQRLERDLPGITTRTHRIPGPHLAISSTALRHRLANGLPVRYQIPDPVVDYIAIHGLYRESP
jgi:nicotinate-nucleotide adenylyltransferase